MKPLPSVVADVDALDAAPSRPRVALVEDNPDNRLLVRTLIEEVYVVDEYENGPAALVAIVADPPAAVLLDISLPGMDGIEVLRRLRASLGAALPVLALTAHAMAGDRERFLAEGFDWYLAKPITSADVLLDVLAAMIRTRVRAT